MLSHLRFHRKGTSNPTSPAPDQPSPSPLSAQQSPFTPDGVSPLDGHASSAASSSLPPTLPPIARVTSTEINFESSERHNVKPSRSESRLQQVPRSLPFKRESGFMGGVALRNYRRDVEAQQTAGADNLEDKSKSQRPRPTSINTDLPTRSMPQIFNSSKPTSSFSTPANLQPSSTASNNRPSSSRISSEPPPSFNSVTTIEPQKGRKGLPFLKNPMSTLLARRKANQNTQNKLPTP
ncbi:hypothetical protein PT974_02686 [Cladobotryum mycophilum]|uniref:Uncharacterized protein n=1 Tax=Cladobotryum mycophilum TaxID=491253 RepID=A0ABR0SYS4_9HYPO